MRKTKYIKVITLLIATVILGIIIAWTLISTHYEKGEYANMLSDSNDVIEDIADTSLPLDNVIDYAYQEDDEQILFVTNRLIENDDIKTTATILFRGSNGKLAVPTDIVAQFMGGPDLTELISVFKHNDEYYFVVTLNSKNYDGIKASDIEIVDKNGSSLKKVLLPNGSDGAFFYRAESIDEDMVLTALNGQEEIILLKYGDLEMLL